MSVDTLVQFALNGMLNSMWISLLLALVTWTLLRVLVKTNAATRHVLWWAVLLLILLLPLRGLDEFLPFRATPRTMHSVSTTVQPIQPAAAQPARVERAVAQPVFPIELDSRPWLPVAVCVWVLFCLLQLVRIAISFSYIRSIKRRSQPAAPELSEVCQYWAEACGIRRSVRLLVSDQVATPLATGFLNPAIILPAQLAPELRGQQLDYVLLHELAHVARCDDWSNLAGRALAAFVGLHPVAAWVLRRVERERELACDDWVVAMTGEAGPYAASLARLFEICRDRRRMMLAAGMAGSGSQLGERIDTLLDRGREFTRGASKLCVAAIVAVLAIFTITFALHAPRWIMLARHRQIPAASVHPARVVNPRPVMVAVRFANLPPQPSFLEALSDAGYGNLSVEDIITLKNNGVSPGYLSFLAKLKCPHMTVADIVALVRAGVSAPYLSAMQHAGFAQLTINDIIAMHAQRVAPALITEIHALGFGPYTPASAIEFQRRGIFPQFFRSLRDAGYKKVDANGVIDAFTSGVRPSTLMEVHQYKSQLSLPQVIKLKQAKVLR